MTPGQFDRACAAGDVTGADLIDLCEVLEREEAWAVWRLAHALGIVKDRPGSVVEWCFPFLRAVVEEAISAAREAAQAERDRRVEEETWSRLVALAEASQKPSA
jgi:hypothetical protein